MLPEAYIVKMQELLKDEYSAYEASFNSPAYHGLRVNTSKIKVEDFVKNFPYKLEPIPWTDDGFYYFDQEVSKHPYYYAGLYYLQEPSAMLPAQILPIKEDDLVLDACAAPGGKSTKLLNKLNDTGLLLANDISASRAQGLLRNIEKQGFERYFVSANDVKDLEKKYSLTFDKILLDAPCSGEGMFRKEPSLVKSWLEKGNDYYGPIQKELIIACLKMLKDGGQLLYSTCTFDPKEDEEVIEYALNNFKDLKLLPLKMHPGFVSGYKQIGVKLFPQRIKGEGHFVCLLQKGENKEEKLQVNKEIYQPKNEFFQLVNKAYYNVEERVINDHLYLVPKFASNKIRILRSGLLVGKLTKNGLEPSTAFARTLKAKEFRQSVELDEEQVKHYLKGETLKLASQIKGLVLVCYQGFSLGFGKLDKGILKNKIDKGWIIQ